MGIYTNNFIAYQVNIKVCSIFLHLCFFEIRKHKNVRNKNTEILIIILP